MSLINQDWRYASKYLVAKKIKLWVYLLLYSKYFCCLTWYIYVNHNFDSQCPHLAMSFKSQIIRVFYRRMVYFAGLLKLAMLIPHFKIGSMLYFNLAWKLWRHSHSKKIAKIYAMVKYLLVNFWLLRLMTS